MEQSEFLEVLGQAKVLGYTVEGLGSETAPIRIYRNPEDRDYGCFCPITFVAFVVLKRFFDIWDYSNAALAMGLHNPYVIVSASDAFRAGGSPLRTEIVKALAA